MVYHMSVLHTYSKRTLNIAFHPTTNHLNPPLISCNTMLSGNIVSRLNDKQEYEEM